MSAAMKKNRLRGAIHPDKYEEQVPTVNIDGVNYLKRSALEAMAEQVRLHPGTVPFEVMHTGWEHINENTRSAADVERLYDIARECSAKASCFF